MTNKNRALGNALEARVVSRARKRGLAAARQPGSGVYREYPNDVVVEDLLVECKVRSTHPSLGDLLGWLYGVQDNARRIKKRAGVLVYNTKGERTPKAIMDLDLLLELLHSEHRALDKEKSA